MRAKPKPESIEKLRAFHLGSTLLKCYKKSPAQFLHQFETRRESTPAQVFGQLYHLLILEPERFADSVVVFDLDKRPEPDKTMAAKANKEWLESLKAQCAESGNYLISGEDYVKLMEMRTAMMSDDLMSRIFTGGRAEQEIYLDDFNGVRVRAKPDYVRGTVMIDLKTAENPHPTEFQYTAARYGYHIQMAFYLDIMREAGHTITDVLIVAQAKEPPYESVIYKCSDQFLTVGQSEYTELLEMHKLCLEKMEFPGVDIYAEDKTGMFDLSIPNYQIHNLTFDRSRI